jgi:hypothetical protein
VKLEWPHFTPDFARCQFSPALPVSRNEEGRAMTKAQRNATVALVTAAVMMVAGPASAQDEPTTATGKRHATIVLHVSNYAALPREILDVAMARVAMVYERIGARVVWVDDHGSVKRREDGQLHLTVLLLSREMAEKKISADGIKDGVLAQAHVTGRRASIFCDRIATAPGAPTNFPIPLGDVIAHEVGHLLLGADSHSRSGIMRAYTNVHALHLQGFDKRQADTIRTALLEPSGGAIGR